MVSVPVSGCGAFGVHFLMRGYEVYFQPVLTIIQSEVTQNISIQFTPEHLHNILEDLKATL